MSKNVESVVLTHHTGKAEVAVSLHGSTVTSWKIFGNEMLFLSKTAVLDGSKPIRGGIPLVFPQFGPGKLQQHGFARTSLWTFEGEEHDVSSGDCTGTFRLVSSEETLAVWPHKFELLYHVRVGMSNVTTQLTCFNRDDAPFDFTALLHTYFRVDSIDKATVTGLGGLAYRDRVRNNGTFKQTSPVIVFGDEIDRVYARGGGAVDESGRVRAEGLIAVGDGGNCDVVMRSVNFPDVVVWSPGAAKAAAMGDLNEGGWRDFVCVEAGSVSAPVSLAPGAQWSAGQSLTLRILSSAGEQVKERYGESSVPGADYPKMERIAGLRSKKDGANDTEKPKEE